MKDENVILDALKYGSTAPNLRMGASELRKVDNFWRGIDTDENEDDIALEIICSDDPENSGIVELTDADHWYLEKLSEKIVLEDSKSSVLKAAGCILHAILEKLNIFSNKNNNVVEVFNKDSQHEVAVRRLLTKYSFFMQPRLAVGFCVVVGSMFVVGDQISFDSDQDLSIDESQYRYAALPEMDSYPMPVDHKNKEVASIDLTEGKTNVLWTNYLQPEENYNTFVGDVGSFISLPNTLISGSSILNDGTFNVADSINSDREVFFKSRGEVIERIEVGKTNIKESEDGSFHRSMLKENGEGLVVMKVVVSEKHNSFYASALQLGRNADKEISSYIIDLRPYLSMHQDLDLAALRPGDFLAAALHVSKDKVEPLMATIFHKNEASVLVDKKWYNNIKDEEEVCDEKYECIPAVRLLSEASVQFSSIN